MQRACSSFLLSYVRAFSGLQGAMKEKRMRQLGELRAGPRVDPGVRPAKLRLEFCLEGEAESTA